MARRGIPPPSPTDWISQSLEGTGGVVITDSPSRYLNFAQTRNIEYRVALGLAIEAIAVFGLKAGMC